MIVLSGAMFRLLFPLLLSITAIPSCRGFLLHAPQRLPSSSGTAKATPKQNAQFWKSRYSDPTTITSLYGGGDDNSHDKSKENISIPETDDSRWKSQGSREREIIGKAFDAIFLLFSYAIQFAGAVFSFGLLLNLCGYMYVFDMEHGLEVGKIENMRTTLQFRGEVQRKSVNVLDDTSSTLPR